MSIDYYSCEHCGDTFPDCGSYISCGNCGTMWCSDECADADGYKIEYCELEIELDECGFRKYEDCEEQKRCLKFNTVKDDEWIDCSDCQNYHPESCKYCRHEDYSDDILLNKAMELLKCDRQFLIDKVNNK